MKWRRDYAVKAPCWCFHNLLMTNTNPESIILFYSCQPYLDSFHVLLCHLHFTSCSTCYGTRWIFPWYSKFFDCMFNWTFSLLVMFEYLPCVYDVGPTLHCGRVSLLHYYSEAHAILAECRIVATLCADWSLESMKNTSLTDLMSWFANHIDYEIIFTNMMFDDYVRLLLRHSENGKELAGETKKRAPHLTRVQDWVR